MARIADGITSLHPAGLAHPPYSIPTDASRGLLSSEKLARESSRRAGKFCRLESNALWVLCRLRSDLNPAGVAHSSLRAPEDRGVGPFGTGAWGSRASVCLFCSH